MKTLFLIGLYEVLIIIGTKNDTEHNSMLPICWVSLYWVSHYLIVMLSVITLSVVMLNVAAPYKNAPQKRTCQRPFKKIENSNERVKGWKKGSKTQIFYGFGLNHRHQIKMLATATSCLVTKMTFFYICRSSHSCF